MTKFQKSSIDEIRDAFAEPANVSAQQDEMIFNIFHDSGDRISGTVIPDSYSDVCHIRVGVGGREIAVFPTNEFNPGALAQGLHESGLVNFSITEQSLPGLSAFADLEIREAKTDILLYRRFQPSMLFGKYLRLETHLLPLWRLDDAVEFRFQQHYRGIDTLSFYTSRQIFHLSQGLDLCKRAISNQEFHVLHQ